MKTQAYFDKEAPNYGEERNLKFLNSFVKKIVQQEKKIIFKHLAVQKRETILDAGCGNGDYMKTIKDVGGKPYGIDFSEKMIIILKNKGLEGETANLEQFTLDKTFDKILCAGALEFVHSPSNVLAHFNQHLKNHGILIILYPRISLGGIIYKTYHLLHGINITLFSKKKIKRLLKQANFALLNLENAGPNCTVLKAQKIQSEAL